MYHIPMRLIGKFDMSYMEIPYFHFFSINQKLKKKKKNKKNYLRKSNNHLNYA